jgi:N6-adenosine-specific RNA methylase IME4
LLQQRARSDVERFGSACAIAERFEGYGVNVTRNDYRVVLADPPWMYYGDPDKDQAAGKHYPLMTTRDIGALPVHDIVKRPAVCFMWATGPRLPEAIEVMRNWGFCYRGVAYVWVKTSASGKIIHGQGVRPTFVKPTTEFVLVGSTNARGRALPLLTEGQPQVLLAPRPGNRHSAKPSQVHERIVELLGDVPRIELFARQRVEGWDAWGNEV